MHGPDPIVTRGRRAPIPSRRQCWPIRSGSRCWWCCDSSRPAERLAFVLHDMFGVPFDEIAPIVDRSTRRRAASSRAEPDAGCTARRSRRMPTSAATRESSTRSSPRRAAATSTRWSRCSTRTSCCVGCRPGRPARRARRRGRRRPGAHVRRSGTDIERVLVNGVAGLLARKDGRPSSLLAVTVVDGRIVEIDVLADRERLARLID